jgi:Ca-activated chloride channel family protein
VLAALAALGAGKSDDTAAGLVERGRSAYAEGRFTEALAAFDRAIALDPHGAVPRYNAGAALFQLQRFPDALSRYQEARERAGAAFRTKIDYALGNTALSMGEVAAALGHYDDCLASTARGAPLDAVRRDAAINRRFAEQQARQPSAPPESEQDPSGQNPRDRRPKSQQGDGPGSESQSPGQSGAQGRSAQESVGKGRRGPGGAGGSGAAPPGPGSPEERLAAALKDLRDARDHRRIDDELPAVDKHRRDW